MWITNLMVLLLIGVRTGALQQGDTQEHRCYLCSSDNGTGSWACQPPGGPALSVVVCPVDRPYCATFATEPDFQSSLTCAAPSDTPCSLTYSLKQNLEMSCTCSENLCNAPFSDDLTNELHKFASLNYTRSNSSESLASVFFNTSKLVNVSTGVYASVIVKNNVEIGNVSMPQSSALPITTKPSVIEKKESIPRTAALKQEATPSDDEEDETEGSGYEEPHSHRRPASQPSAPAAPSSYLPAENKASASLTNLLFTAPLFLHFIL